MALNRLIYDSLVANLVYLGHRPAHPLRLLCVLVRNDRAHLLALLHQVLIGPLRDSAAGIVIFIVPLKSDLALIPSLVMLDFPI